MIQIVVAGVAALVVLYGMGWLMVWDDRRRGVLGAQWEERDHGWIFLNGIMALTGIVAVGGIIVLLGSIAIAVYRYIHN